MEALKNLTSSGKELAFACPEIWNLFNFFCRRCGECEGCMRDDCGQCAACADKPKFGGRGSKKKACAVRACRMKGSLGGSASNQQKQTGQAQAQPQQQHMMVKLPNGQILQIVGQLTTQPTK